jgi:hypothetical protein
MHNVDIDRINMISFIENLGFKPSGPHRNNKAQFLSPLREEKNPSFSVGYYNGKWRWRDWATGEHGNIIEFVKKFYNVDFKEAIRILKKEVAPSVPDKPLQKSNDKYSDKDWVKKMYQRAIRNLGKADLRKIERFFEGKKVKYYKEMGAILYFSKTYKKVYVAIPLPSPDNIVGLECRELNGDHRISLGHKDVWLFKRDVSKILVTESVLDALAGEIFLKDKEISLCSINGVGNIERIKGVIDTLKPKKVIFALDNDKPGYEALNKGIQLLKGFSVRKSFLNTYLKKRNVKDLHKLIGR